MNSNRGDYPLTEGSGKYSKKGKACYSGDDWRGGVARIVLYINLRYDDSIDDVCTGEINLLLEWNAKDPVSELEKNVMMSLKKHKEIVIRLLIIRIWQT